jgi:23S rRNA (pseudouridine1915-N3)-methyltransferase
LADKHAYDAAAILQAAGSAHKVALVIDGGREYSSPELAYALEQRTQTGQEVCYIIGGPKGLPPAVIEACDARWSFSKLTFPHDLAMVILAEALYRASTITAGHPYHKV